MAARTSGPDEPRTTGFLGSLKDALAAASRDDTGKPQLRSAKPADGSGTDAGKSPAAVGEPPASIADRVTEIKTKDSGAGVVPSAASAAREVRGVSKPLEERHIEMDAPPTTRVIKPSKQDDDPPRTQLVRGKLKVERGEFDEDPVVGWLVVVGGPGIGSYRPVFEGNNTVGRALSNRIPIDFGDEAISSEEQAYIRYDSSDRSFLFVPNLSKTNVVSVNDRKPTGAVALSQMDVITMGRTQLVFVPFCGPDFDWAALAETKD